MGKSRFEFVLTTPLGFTSILLLSSSHIDSSQPLHLVENTRDLPPCFLQVAAGFRVPSHPPLRPHFFAVALYSEDMSLYVKILLPLHLEHLFSGRSWSLRIPFIPLPGKCVPAPRFFFFHPPFTSHARNHGPVVKASSRALGFEKVRRFSFPNPPLQPVAKCAERHRCFSDSFYKSHIAPHFSSTLISAPDGPGE